MDSIEKFNQVLAAAGLSPAAIGDLARANMIEPVATIEPAAAVDDGIVYRNACVCDAARAVFALMKLQEGAGHLPTENDIAEVIEAAMHELLVAAEAVRNDLKKALHSPFSKMLPPSARVSKQINALDRALRFVP